MTTFAVFAESRGGLSLLGRRLAQDARARRRLMEILERPVFATPYTRAQFAEPELRARIVPVPDPAAIASGSAILETDGPPENFGRLVVVRWNRRYLFDKRLETDLKALRLVHSEDLEGSSHKRITIEVYEHA